MYIHMYTRLYVYVCKHIVFYTCSFKRVLFPLWLVIQGQEMQRAESSSPIFAPYHYSLEYLIWQKGLCRCNKGYQLAVLKIGDYTQLSVSLNLIMSLFLYCQHNRN
jgi:hypothetical protein